MYSKNFLWENIPMDSEEIAELVDGFMDKLVWEFGQLSKELVVNAEGAAEEVKILGLSQEEAPYLIFNLADPMGTIGISQERCRTHVKDVFDILNGLDLEEEKLARIMIHKGLRELHSEIGSLFSSDD